MREILFRGKWRRTGEWVYGLLFVYNEKTASIYSDDLDRHCWVEPNTVGQYTGLTDKIGKKIFEDGYMIIDKQTYKVLFDNGEYILKNIFNCDIIQLKNNSNIGVFVDEI